MGNRGSRLIGGHLTDDSAMSNNHPAPAQSADATPNGKGEALFAGASAQSPSDDSTPSEDWKLLVVDDEPEVHSVTRLVLNGFRYAGRGLRLIDAYSAQEARQILQSDPEIAVVLLDVVMETEDAGLEVAQFIRHSLGNRFIRIVLRTGHPGMAPERRVIQAYDINDYRCKTELTRDRMFSIMHTSLSTYQHLISLTQSRQQLSALRDNYQNMLARVADRLSAPSARIREASTALRQALGQATPESLSQKWDLLEDGLTHIGQIARVIAEQALLDKPQEIPRDFSPTEAINVACERCAPLIQQTSARIEIGDFPRLCGYPEAFTLMMEHLLSNALLYQDQRPAEVDIWIEPCGHDWRISIADRGRGVAVDRIDEIFEPFVGSPSRLSSQRDGLGLVLCRKVAALHGGRISVEPRAGGGSIFQVRLPAHHVQYD